MTQKRRLPRRTSEDKNKPHVRFLARHEFVSGVSGSTPHHLFVGEKLVQNGAREVPRAPPSCLEKGGRNKEERHREPAHIDDAYTGKKENNVLFFVLFPNGSEHTAL